MSANDLARWDIAFAQGKLLSEPARRALATPRVLRDGRTTSYSCGFAVRTVNRETVLDHGGWVGGFWAHNALVPRTASAVVLLTNDQHVSLGDLHDRIVRLVTEDVSAIPAIPGPPAAEAARELIVQLQHGIVDRAKVGDDLAAYLADPRFAAAAARLRALGAPTVTLVSRRERGHMEVSSLRVAFANASYSASMFRSPDGKIRQLLLMP
jgi:CubicO group peptidase (beta-lactamase class C family)